MALLIKIFFICISVYAVLSQNTGRHSLGEELNPRLVDRYLKCLQGKAPCDPQGKRLKALAPTILRGQCSQCTPQEIMMVRKALSYVQRYHPADWAELVRMYG